MQKPDVTGATGPTIAETLSKLGADEKAGLTDAEVQARLKKYGPNALVEKQKSAFAALLAYFWGPIPWMIEAAALMAFIVGGWGDFTIITSERHVLEAAVSQPAAFFAIVATQIAAMFMCSQGWLVPALPWGIIGFVWAYNVVWMIAQDVVKLGLYGIGHGRDRSSSHCELH